MRRRFGQIPVSGPAQDARIAQIAAIAGQPGLSQQYADRVNRANFQRRLDPTAQISESEWAVMRAGFARRPLPRHSPVIPMAPPEEGRRFIDIDTIGKAVASEYGAVARRATAASIQALGWAFGPFTPRGLFISAVLARRLRQGTRAEGGVLDAVATMTAQGLMVGYKVGGRMVSSVLPPGSEALMGAEQAAAARIWAWACGADGAPSVMDFQRVPESWFQSAASALA